MIIADFISKFPRVVIRPISLFFGISFLACTPSFENQCALSSECPPNQFCTVGQCESLSYTSFVEQRGLSRADTDNSEPSLLNNGANTNENNQATQNHDTNSTVSACPDAAIPDASTLVLTEILVNVPTGDEGDANGDGLRHAHDDEFIELFNDSPNTLSLYGTTLANDTKTRFIFPDICLPSGHAVVVFGGIEPGISLPDGPSFQSFVADSRFSFSNSSGRFIATNRNGQELIRFDYDKAPAQSYQRTVELNGDSRYVNHQDINPHKLFSPGYCANGNSYEDGCEPIDVFADADMDDDFYDDNI